MKKIALIVCLVLGVVSCKATMQDGSTKVTVQDGANSAHPHGGGFCPPGQAKKGNC